MAESGGKGIGCLALLAVPVVVVVWAFASGGSDEDSPALQQVGAQSACEDWVKDRLKAPKTAEMSEVTVSGVGPWTVTGMVDAENSFGATLRSQWTCTVRLDGQTFRGNATLLE